MEQPPTQTQKALFGANPVPLNKEVSSALLSAVAEFAAMQIGVY